MTASKTLSCLVKTSLKKKKKINFHIHMNLQPKQKCYFSLHTYKKIDFGVDLLATILVKDLEWVRTRSLDPHFMTTTMNFFYCHRHWERSTPWSQHMERDCFFTESCFDLKVSHWRAFFTHECNSNSSILYHSYYSRTFYVSWQRRVCEYSECASSLSYPLSYGNNQLRESCV